MKSLSNFATRRAAAVGAVLTALALAIVLLVPASSEAAKCGLELYYFSDAAHTDLIGLRAYTPTECGCTLSAWGSISTHREIYESYCF